MANRHKYTCTKGGNESVLKAAKERKDGGQVVKRASGGEVGKVAGRASGGRLDRKSGGGVKSPFSSAGGGSADKSPIFK